MKTLEMHPEVYCDVFSSVQWYERKQSGVGTDFADEVKRTYPKIQNNPKSWPIRRKDVRQCRVQGYPFKVIFVERPSAIWIVAVAHEKRHPDFWTDRLDDIP